MAINNYTSLKTAIASWAKRSDITTLIDDFIDLAEADMWQRLRIRDMEARATASASTTDRFLELPDSYNEMRKMRLFSGNRQYDLEFRVPESLIVIPSAGTPTDYTITSQIEFNRTADSAYTVEMQYFKSLTALSGANATNAVITRFPMIYLWGSLYHFACWAQDNELMLKNKALFDEAIDKANRLDRKGRYGAAKSIKTERSTP